MISEDTKDWVKDLNKRYRQIRSPITPDQLKLLDPECECVQFTEALSDKEHIAVSELISSRPDVTFRVYGHSRHGLSDLSFLKYYGSIRNFQWDLWDIPSWDGLEYLPEEMEFIGIGRTKSRAKSVSFLKRHRQLQDLHLEGHTKGIEAISSLRHLKRLSLRSITLPDLSIIKPLQGLESFELRLGGTTDIDLLSELSNLKYLELWMIRGLRDISVISRMPTLEKLHLESLKQITDLPSLAGLKQLKHVTIQNMKGLYDLTGLAAAPNLETLAFYDSRHLKPDHFNCFVGHPTLRKVTAALGSIKQDDAVSNLLGLPCLHEPD